MAAKPDITDLDNLADLVRRECADIRPALLRLMTDFYMSKPMHSEEQTQRYTDLALLLLDKVDAETRSAIADKLTCHASPPPRVMQRLLRDEIDVTLAPPAAAPFAGTPVEAEVLSESFFSATPAERRLILINLAFSPLSPAEPIAPAIARPVVERLEQAALAYNTAKFTMEFEAVLGVSRTDARRMIDDEDGEPIVVAALALGMPATVLQRILLCLNPAVGRSVQRVYQLAWLYDEVEPHAALRMLAIWRASRKAEPASPKAVTKPTASPPQDWTLEKSVRPALPARPKIAWEEHVQQKIADSA